LDKISLTQFCAGPTSRAGCALDLGTGLSRQGVLNGIQGLKEKGLVKVIPGRGRSQVSTFEVDLSTEARLRIETLKILPREKVTKVDPYRTHRKGQRATNQKVNGVPESYLQRGHLVDRQEKGNIQQKVRQQEIGFAGHRSSRLNPSENRGNAEYLERKLEGITCQRLTSSEKRKLQTISNQERVAEVMDSFSTEAHWVESPRKNAAFFDYFNATAAERWRQEEWND
jgi:hypothetical protein